MKRGGRGRGEKGAERRNKTSSRTSLTPKKGGNAASAVVCQKPDNTKAAGRIVPWSTVDIAVSVRFDLTTRTVRNKRLLYRRRVNAMHVALQNRRESTSCRTRR